MQAKNSIFLRHTTGVAILSIESELLEFSEKWKPNYVRGWLLSRESINWFNQKVIFQFSIRAMQR